MLEVIYIYYRAFVKFSPEFPFQEKYYVLASALRMQSPYRKIRSLIVKSKEEHICCASLRACRWKSNRCTHERVNLV